jgi:hypothetical protein
MWLVAERSGDAGCERVVIRRLARVGNGRGCDERRNECVNERVVVGGLCRVLRDDGTKTQVAS